MLADIQRTDAAHGLIERRDRPQSFVLRAEPCQLETLFLGVIHLNKLVGEEVPFDGHLTLVVQSLAQVGIAVHFGDTRVQAVDVDLLLFVVDGQQAQGLRFHPSVDVLGDKKHVAAELLQVEGRQDDLVVHARHVHVERRVAVVDHGDHKGGVDFRNVDAFA